MTHWSFKIAKGVIVPEPTSDREIAHVEQALAEIVFLVGCFSMVAVTLNAFDASVPGREENLD